MTVKSIDRSTDNTGEMGCNIKQKRGVESLLQNRHCCSAARFALSLFFKSRSFSCVSHVIEIIKIQKIFSILRSRIIVEIAIVAAAQ